MKDVQSERDHRNIPLEKVGVEGLLYPIKVMQKSGGLQETIAKISMSVDLPHEFRGTHMSRFIEVLDSYSHRITLRNLERMLDELKNVLNAQTAHIEMEFPYFLIKEAPISRIPSYMSYICKFKASKSDKFDFILEVNTPVQTVCPCSKEISDYGAHNQRANVKIEVRMSGLVWIEDIVKIAEESASSPVFSLLKREDEKFVTEHAHDNPRFAEDVAREATLRLERNPKITWYRVTVVSYESIHNHNAFACVSKNTVMRARNGEKGQQGGQ
ncbi:MAG: GTP cyclohydrolase I FolE2 [Candidatus Hydrothermota bacterium]|nr:MAG: GTP cyclohydrolase I FolE2 [Candidatus Hydrothermae bacterium]